MSNICIIGGGLSGLAAADYLVKKGHSVTLYEKEKFLGGVASNIHLNDGRIIPKAYHQIVGTDLPLIKTLKERNIFDKTSWKKIKIKFYINNSITDISNPLDLFKSDLLSFRSKLSLVYFGLRCLLKKDWSDFENYSVKDLIYKYSNEEVYKKVFIPLIDIKYGLHPDQLSASWLGLRLSKREAKTPFGFIKNTSWTDVLINSYSDSIRKNSGNININSTLEKINIKDNKIESIQVNNENLKFDAYLSTIELPEINRLITDNIVSDIEYISSYSLVAGVDTETFKDYWTVAHTPRFSFGGCFVLDKLNNTLLTKEDKSIINCFVNVPYKKFNFTDEEFANKCKKDLEVMLNKKINFNWFNVTKINATSPIFLKNYKNEKEKILDNFYFAGIYKTFPKLSSTGTAIEDGLETAKFLHEDLL